MSEPSERDPDVARPVRDWEVPDAVRTGEARRTLSRYFLGHGEERMVELALPPEQPCDAPIESAAAAGAGDIALLVLVCGR